MDPQAPLPVVIDGIRATGNWANRGGFLRTGPSTPPLTVRGSTFVGNRARVVGGAFSIELAPASTQQHNDQSAGFPSASLAAGPLLTMFNNTYLDNDAPRGDLAYVASFASPDLTPMPGFLDSLQALPHNVTETLVFALVSLPSYNASLLANGSVPDWMTAPLNASKVVAASNGSNIFLDLDWARTAGFSRQAIDQLNQTLRWAPDGVQRVSTRPYSFAVDVTTPWQQISPGERNLRVSFKNNPGTCGS